MPRASKPTRTYGKANLSLGMINFPIDTYNSVVSDHGIKRKQFAKATGNPVAYKKVDAVLGTDLATDDIVSKIPTEYGPVEVADHEIETLFSISPDTIKVLEFEPQHLFHMGHYVPKGLLYCSPGRTEVKKKKVVTDATLEAYSIFMAAMRVAGLMAIVEFTNRGVPKPGILLPNGNLWLIHHTDEIREPLSPDLMEVPDEIAKHAANTYFAGMISTNVRDLNDDRTALIQGFAEDKAKAGNFGAAPAPATPTAPAAPAGGLMAALAASVEQAKQQQAAAG